MSTLQLKCRHYCMGYGRTETDGARRARTGTIC